VTLLPALVVIMLGLDATRSLVFSQVILSFCIPIALVPLVWFTSRRGLMGDLVNHRVTTALASAVAISIVALNGLLVYRTLAGAS
jgi:manganese transport protein